MVCGASVYETSIATVAVSLLQVCGEGRGFRPVAAGHRVAEAAINLWKLSNPR